ncbi:MAG: hypothetical protein V3T84_03530 [Phycisphaerales bacterium]
MRKGLIGVLNIVGATLLNGAAWGQCEVTQLASQGGFGRVSIDGDVAVIGDTDAFGSFGAAYVYRRGLGGPQDWTLQATLMAPEPDSDDQFGSAVAVGDGVIVVSAHKTNGDAPHSGSAYTYRYDGAVWQYQTMLTASDSQPGAIFGFSVAIDGDVILIGARDDPNEGVFQSGSAYIFRFDGANWIEETKLVDPDHEPCDLLGAVVSIRGDVALVGAHGNDDAGLGTGAAFIFRRDPKDGSQWLLEQQLQAFDVPGNAWFGFSVSLTQNLALVGAPQDDAQLGAAYVMRYDGTRWVHETKLVASNPVGPFPLLGRSVSLSDDGTNALVAAPLDDEAGDQAGAIHLFRSNAKTWQEFVKIIASDASPGDHLGLSVSLSGDMALAKSGGRGYIFAGIQGIDCNENNEPDACDIFGGKSSDDNGNGIPDECESIPGDIDGDGTVGATDLLILLTSWGPCENCDDCPADLDGNCTVGASDLLILLVNWG